MNETVEAIRKRPAMYTGSTSVRGFNQLLKDLVVGALHLTGADYFSFETIDRLKGKIVVDNIRKAVRGDLAVALDKFDGETFQTLEPVILNALSKTFSFGLYDENDAVLLEQNFERGLIARGEIIDRDFEAKKIEIAFELDDSIFEIEGGLNPDFYLEELRNLAYLHKNKTLAVAYRAAGHAARAIFNFPNGLRDSIEVQKLKGHGGTFFDTYFEHQFDDFDVEAAFAFREYDHLDEPYLKSFVNYIYTPEEGTHVNGLLKGLTEAVSKYRRKRGFSEKSLVSKKRLRETLVAAIHVRVSKVSQLLFEGSVRNKLIAPNVTEPIAGHVADLLLEKMENDPETAQRFIHERRFLR